MLLGLLTQLGTAGSQAPYPVEEDGEQGWLGLRNTLVGVAVVGAAALTSTSIAAERLQWQDEVVPPQAVGGGVLKDPAKILFWPANEEAIFTAATPIVEDVDWVPPVPQWLQPVIWTPPDDQQWVPATAPQENDEWNRPAYQSWTAPIKTDWHQDEVVTTPSALNVEEDYWIPPRANDQKFVRIWTDQDERPTPAPFAYEEDGPTLKANVESVTFIVWVTQDEVTTPTGSIGGGVLKDPANIRFWPANDDFVQFTAPTFVPEEDYWLRFNSPVWPTQIKIWDHQDEVAVLQIEENEWQQFTTVTTPLQSRVWVEDDFVPTPVVALQIDEEPWQPLNVPQVKPYWQTWSDEDFIGTPSVVEENEWNAPNIPTVYCTIQPWTEDDFVPTPQTIVEEEYWQPTLVPNFVFNKLWIDQDELINLYTPDENDWPVYVPNWAQPYVTVWQDIDLATPIPPSFTSTKVWWG